MNDISEPCIKCGVDIYPTKDKNGKDCYPCPNCNKIGFQNRFGNIHWENKKMQRQKQKVEMWHDKYDY